MSTFYDLFKNKSATPAPLKHGRFVGIEIEMENVTGLAALPDAPNASLPLPGSNWSYKIDGSLRNNGMEFVTVPVPSTTINADLDLFQYYINHFGWRSSERCGIHVHVDCRDYSSVELRNLVATYCLVEPLLFDFVGKEREENIFCVPWYRASDNLDFYITDIMSRTKLNDVSYQLRHYMCKYSALYLEPLTRFGTVEFRHAPTWTNMAKLKKWVELCVKVVDFAYKTSAEDAVKLYEGGPQSFVDAVFGNSNDFTRVAERIEENDSDFLARKVIGFEVNKDGWKAPPIKREIPKSKRPASTKTKKAIPRSYLQAYLDEGLATQAGESNQITFWNN